MLRSSGSKEQRSKSKPPAARMNAELPKRLLTGLTRGSVEELAATLQPDRITTDRVQESKCKSQSNYSTAGKTRN
jgi:hypothetical protein